MFNPQILGNNTGSVPSAPQYPPEPVPRIKPKHGYEWYQDNKIVKIRIPMKGITMKKIDVFISDLVLKINITEKKWVRVLDLKHEVDFQSKENSVVYANEVLEIVIVKQEEKKEWEDLIEDTLDKEQIKQRRQESFQRRETAYQEHLKQRSDLKIKFDTHATKEQMRLEDESRKVLEDKKTEEKNLINNKIIGQLNQEALQNIYKDIDESGNIHQAQPKQAQKVEVKPQIIWTHKYDDNIFTDDDIFKNEELAVQYEDKPKVREQKKLDIGFTQRLYPGVAVREQQFKEAPLPKIKQQQEKSGDDLENKNPLWLKDRADEFYKNQDFYSAIMAYNQAYKLDQTMINCIANRCACNIHLFNYEEALMDADLVLTHIDALKQDEKDLAKNQSLRVKTILRKAIATSWKGDVERSLELLEKSLSEDIFFLKDNSLIPQFESAKETIKKRQESIIVKKQGDTLFKAARYEQALEKYFKSLEIDHNETAMGNISLTYLKMDKNQDCIDFCNKCIEKVQKFTRFASFNPINRQSVQDSNNFLVKLYIRKAKAQQQLKQLKEAFETIKQAIQIHDKNSEAKEIHKEIEKSFIIEEVNQLKAQAATYMKENKVNEALEIYNECLKKIDTTETIDYLAILLNRCACFLKLEKFEDIITNCLRGLKIIRSYKNRVISWTNQKLTKEEKEKLINFESRFLVRRANAYLKQNLIYNAKQDLEEAYKLDPTNEQLKQDIQKIDVSISETKK